MKKIIPLFCISVFLFISCQKKAEEPEKIIARIGDRTISKNEFIRRAEYTIRPAYCKQGNAIIHKKIILNSLIAEKLLALEAGQDNALMNNENFRAYIRGRKEQAMRRILYNREAYDRVRLNDTELSDFFKVAGRKYHMLYFNVPDQAVAQEIQKTLANAPEQFISVYEKYYGNTNVPVRDVAWTENEDPQIDGALFTRPLKNGTVIGPLPIESNQFLFMKIDGWIDTRVFTEPDIRQRWDKVKERLTLRKATVLWDQYIHRIMKGKHLEFQEESFYRLADIFAEMYHFDQNEKEVMVNDQFWNRPNPSDLDVITNALKSEAALQNSILFTLDGNNYSVEDFRKMLASHPLVFRKRRFSHSEFPEQFKLAVVDMIADQYLNKEAYKKRLDHHPWVMQTEIMWQDALVGMYHRNAYLESIGKKDAFIDNYLTVIREDLNPYLETLKRKHNDQIEINAEMLKQISLTHIDMFAIQKWEPYPLMVPQFPVVTDEHRMDYGKDMRSNQ